MYRKLIPLIFFATVIVHIPDGAVEEAASWWHYGAEARTETKAEYVTRKMFEYATPVVSFGRFKTPQDAGLTWEVKQDE